MTDEQVEQTDLQKAIETANRIEKGNAEFKALIERQEKMKVTEVLSGRSSAGSAPQAPPTETPLEYKNRVMKNGL